MQETEASPTKTPINRNYDYFWAAWLMYFPELWVMVMNYCEGHDEDEDVDNECDDVLDADDDDIAVLDCVF